MNKKLYKATPICILLMAISLTGCQKDLPEENISIEETQETVATAETTESAKTTEAAESAEEAVPPVFTSDEDFYCWILDNMVSHSNEKDWEWFTQTYAYCNATAYYLCDINEDGREDLFVTGPAGVRDLSRTIAYITRADGYDSVEVDESMSKNIHFEWQPIPEFHIYLHYVPTTYTCAELGYSITFYQQHFVFEDGNVFLQGQHEFTDGEGYFIMYEDKIVGSLTRRDNTIVWDYDEPQDLVIGDSTFVIPCGTVFIEAEAPKYYAIW